MIIGELRDIYVPTKSEQRRYKPPWFEIWIRIKVKIP